MKKKNSHWLICPNWVEVQCFTKYTGDNSKINDYVYIEQGIVMGNYGEKPPLMQKRKQMQISEARKYWQKLITEGWQQTEPKW